MMGRVTFQDPSVIEHVKAGYATTWKNAKPGCRARRIDAATFEKFSGQAAGLDDGDFADDLAATLPNGQANENVATIVANARGEVLHVIPGFWHAEAYLAELAFAEEVARVVEQAGDDRRGAAVAAHAGRLEELNGLGAGPLGRAVLENAHRKLIEDPLRDAADIGGVREFAFQPAETIQPKVERLQRAVARAQREGRELSGVGEAMRDFERLVNEMRVREAEACLDRALGILEGK